MSTGTVNVRLVGWEIIVIRVVQQGSMVRIVWQLVCVIIMEHVTHSVEHVYVLQVGEDPHVLKVAQLDFMVQIVCIDVFV